MKFKKVFFLWLFLALAFFSVKTNATILKMQSDYADFESNEFNVYSEIFMPCKENNAKMFCNTAFGGCYRPAPDVVVVINYNKFSDSEKEYLTNYEKYLAKNDMVMKVCIIPKNTYIFVNIEKLKEISETCQVDEEKMVNKMAKKYYMWASYFFNSLPKFMRK